MMEIAVTGIGVISALGIGKERFWENCLEAAHGIKKIELFDTAGHGSNVAGWVADFDPRQFMPPPVYRRMSRISKMAVAASIEAVADADLSLENMDRDRCAIVLGTADGPSSQVDSFFSSLLENGPRGAQPSFFPETVPNAPASHIAMYHGITGPNTTFCQNMISAEKAIIYARDLILMGQADLVMAGGADELSGAQFACYDALGALCRVRENGTRITDFSPGAGMVLGEGAGMLILEPLDKAMARGSKIYGVISGGAVAGGCADMGHYESDGKQMSRAMQMALSEANLQLQDISQLNVSANYTRELDTMEAEQIKKQLAVHSGSPRVTPLKYLMGEFGGAGAARAAASLISLYRQTPLPGMPVTDLIPLNGHVPNWSLPPAGNIQSALMTSSTFGGASSCLVFSHAGNGRKPCASC